MRIDEFISTYPELEDLMPLSQELNTKKISVLDLKTLITSDNVAAINNINTKIASQKINAGTDLNTILDPGVRRHTVTDADAKTLLNIPRKNITSFSIETYLVTTATSTNAIQKITERDGTTWIRSLISGVWGAWKLTTSPGVTSANMTIYVDQISGSDTNNGLTSGTAFKTIAKAISIIPQIVNHIVTVNLAPGTYDEVINLNGFVGTQGINVNGGTDLTTALNYMVYNLNVNRCGCFIKVTGVTSTRATTHMCYCNSNINCTFVYCNSTVAANAFNGFYIQNSLCFISHCNVSNRQYAIYSVTSNICSEANTGSGNLVGLMASYSGVIGKNGTQCGGTTAELIGSGGDIR